MRKCLDTGRLSAGRPGARHRRWQRPRLGRAGLLAAALAVVAVLAAACGSSGSPSAGSGGSASSSAGGAQSQGLAYTACMRSHGVANFPDPNSQGHIQLTPSDGIDVNSTQYQSAAKACQKLAPGGVTPAQQAQYAAAALKYAKCMRSHGITDFPDPNAQGGFEIKGATGDMNPSSPRYQAANSACRHFMAGEPGGGQTVTSGGGGGL